jgi:hypothetical protein
MSLARARLHTGDLAVPASVGPGEKKEVLRESSDQLEQGESHKGMGKEKKQHVVDSVGGSAVIGAQPCCGRPPGVVAPARHHDGGSGGTGGREDGKTTADSSNPGGESECSGRPPGVLGEGCGREDGKTTAEMFYIGAEECDDEGMHDVDCAAAAAALRGEVSAALAQMCTGTEQGLLLDTGRIDEVASELIAIVVRELYAAELCAVKAEETAVKPRRRRRPG